MPYPSPDTLAVAAADLAGSHPLTIITIPALLRAARQEAGDEEPLFVDVAPPPTIDRFGTRQERPVLEAFRTRDGESPYLAVWQDPPTYIRRDYPGSTLQRLRTQDLLGQGLFDIAWNAEHTKRTGTALRPTAGVALEQRNVKPVNRLSLALWLGRDQDLDDFDAFLAWFDATYPLDGTDLTDFYVRTKPDYVVPTEPMQGLLWMDQPSNADIVAAVKPFVPEEALDLPSTTPPRVSAVVEDDEPAEVPSDDLRWTRDFCAYPLRDANVARLTRNVLDQT